MAAPSAAPRMACSEIGVSRTRFRAKLFIQPGRDLEHTAGLAHILAKKDHIWIAAQFIAEGFAHGFAIGQFRHGINSQCPMPIAIVRNATSNVNMQGHSETIIDQMSCATLQGRERRGFGVFNRVDHSDFGGVAHFLEFGFVELLVG